MVELGGGAATLVVEDDENTLILIRDYLGRAGFNVRTATNGWEAMKRLKEGPVDIVISALDVADTDGASLREKMMMQPGTRDIPFLFLIPEGQADTLVRALRTGVDDCITKPFDPVVLVARIQAVIQRRLAYERMVRIDPLTRLLNRPTLLGEVEEEVARLNRYKRSGSMVLLDVDEFARVNADSGANMGDLLLTCLAGIILNTVRNMDVAGRYSGESFLLFLPETGWEGASTFAKRMQEQMATIAETVAGTRLSFSCGIVEAPGDGEECGVLLERAHAALEHCKEHSRGGVCVYCRDIAPREEKPNPEAQA